MKVENNMKLVFAAQSLPKSIFLAGPTPRSHQTIKSWRPEAIEHLQSLNFTGSVLIPESEGWVYKNEYNDQVSWEWEALNLSTVVVFWVPRDLQEMPAFTRNIEYGLMIASTKCILGYPPSTPKMTYLERLAQRYNVPVHHEIKDVLAHAVRRCQEPFGMWSATE